MSVDPPEGNVALVFTDVEGSSRLWEQLDNAFKACLDVHDQVLRDAIAAHRGYEVKTEGDAFMVAFGDCADALRFCADAQLALEAAAWPDALPQGVRVRMGVHVGTPIRTSDPLTGRADYYGPMVNRAARIGAAAHGGQVLASAVAAAAAGDGLEVRDLGEHTLAGLNATERLHQVLPRALDGRRFPPPRARAVRTTNVTPAASPLVGRDAMLRTLVDALSRPGITALHGLPGVGKTRLLTEAALRLADATRDVWLADLQGCADAAEGLARVASAVGVPITDATAATSLGHALAARGPTLLVLDGVGSSLGVLRAHAAAWCATAPALHVVVTGRSRVTMEGATQLEVPPLAAPEARALFLAQARAASPGFSADARDVDALVRALDGLPLALVLAAPRVRTVSVPELLRRLDDRFSLLRRQDPSGPVSLAAALDEAWAPLSEAQRQALMSLTLLEGPAGLTWAEHLIEAALPGSFALDLLEELVDHGLVRKEGDRLVLPALVRAHAAHQSTPTQASVRAHRTLCAGLAAPSVCAALRARGLGAVPADVVEALDDLRAAVARATDWDPMVEACAVAAARILALRGPVEAAVGVLTRAAGLRGTPDDDAAALLLEAAHLLMGSGRLDRGEELLEHAAARAAGGSPDRRRLIGSGAALGGTLLGLRGSLALQRGQDSAAEPVLQEALAGALERGERREASLWSAYLGHIRSHRGDLPGAASRFADALAHARAADDPRLQAEWIGNAGYVHQNGHDHAAARRAYEQALALARELQDRRAESLWLGNLGDVLRELRDHEAAAAVTLEALALAREVGDRKREGVWLGNLGDIRLALGDASGEALLRESVSVLDPAWPLGAAVFRRHLAEALRARCALAEARLVIDRAADTLRGLHAVEFTRLAVLAARVARADDDPATAARWIDEAGRTCETLRGAAADALLADIEALRGP
jgi:class 3 adenylate cyclase/tetratricopeptide (TPR) repeat protein